MIRQHSTTVIVNLAAALLLSGCLTGGSTDEVDLSPPSNDSGGPPSNNAPTISGSPGNLASVGSTYTFTPSAFDVDGDSLTFSILNMPSWATFNASNGRLTGTPNMGDEGTYSGILVTVSDGTAQASLPAFTVTVNQFATGSAMLSWTPPTQNSDGSSLNDLAGYKIYFGLSQGNYPNSISIDNPGISSYLVENLPPNTYFFVATAVNQTGQESPFSNVTSKTVTAN